MAFIYRTFQIRPKAFRVKPVYWLVSMSSGTLDTPVAKNNDSRARDIKNSVVKSTAFLNSQFSYSKIPFGAIRQISNTSIWENEIKKKVGFSMDAIRGHLSKELRPALWAVIHSCCDLYAKLVLGSGGFCPRTVTTDRSPWIWLDLYCAKVHLLKRCTN